MGLFEARHTFWKISRRLSELQEGLGACSGNSHIPVHFLQNDAVPARLSAGRKRLCGQLEKRGPAGVSLLRGGRGWLPPTPLWDHDLWDTWHAKTDVPEIGFY